MKSRSLGDIDTNILSAYADGRLPIEAAFEEERTAGVAGALEAGFQFGLEAVVLLGGEIAVARGVDKRARGARAVVEEGFVPAAGGVVNVILVVASDSRTREPAGSE